MAASSLMTFLLLVVHLSLSAYIESVAANVDSRKDKKHEKFMPLVAFECGFRNRFMGENGAWVSDPSFYATCLSGKLDILKYCRKAYPKLDVTNIVEYPHEVEISGWCREEGSPCKWTHTVRPYQCIVGEFHSEALQVPNGCRFGHINDRQSCNDYSHWKEAAYKQCKTKIVDGKHMTARSFAVLEPCGLDMFTGVEFVCCPGDEKAPEVEKKKIEEEDEDEDDEYDEEDDEDGESSEYTDELDDGRDSGSKLSTQDPYFKISDPANEHERFKEVQQRLEKRHRAKINKVMREWSDLEAHYKKMKKIDEKGAEAFKQEMTSRFQKTVASLEEENKEQKKQLEDVHEQRVQAHLNEKKRQATHDYRAALAIQVGTANKHNVLKTLKTYIRAEEKDRTHMLNRFRHLLRTDRDEAETYEPILLHQLRYIDLRINGTLAMLRDFPELERQVRPIAIEFWTDYRRENTPEVTDDEYTAIGGDGQNVKLVHYYKNSYDRIHNPSWLKSTTPTSTTTELKALSESDEDDDDAVDEADADDDDDDDDEDDDIDDESDNDDVKKISRDNVGKVAIEKIIQRKPSNKKTVKSSADFTDSDEKSDEGKSVERELRVEIEPIVSEPVRVHDLPPRPSYAKQDLLHHPKLDAIDLPSDSFTASTHLMLIAASVSAILFTVFAIVFARRQSRHRGFIEVDICTPEERHVSGMQVNGYENPTYSFFDNKP